MPDNPEQAARENIDRLLTQAGWAVQDIKSTNLHAGQGVAIREFPLATGHGCADYLLYVQGKAAVVIEAKKAGATLCGVEVQSAKYQCGLPDSLPAWFRPLPFCYQSTGVETHFTNGFDPDPRSRNLFAFHRPDTLASWLQTSPPAVSGNARDGQEGYGRPATFRRLLKTLPPLIEQGLWAAQIRAILSLEASLADDRPRALIQMATGSGKTFTAINFIYRLIKFAGARRVLFLVDRGNLGRQTKKEFDQYVSPYNNFKFGEEYIVQHLGSNHFGEEYIVQHLGSNHLDRTARIVIATIQRLYSMLKGRELSEEDEDASAAGLENLFKKPEPITYNSSFPIETFDVIVTDECHRSIYNLWRQVLEYFDAHLIGLTATPSKQTFGFFNQNLVMEYNHEQAVADGVNVNYDVYRIRTQVTEEGGRVDAGYYVDLRDRETRKVRWEELEEDFEYDPNQLDRKVVAMDQIRTIVRTFKEKLFTEIFPGRTEVPKTLFFAKDDSHAENIVMVLREEFGKGNDFAQKITYRTTGASPEQLIRDFRTSYQQRIAVSVGMIATGNAPQFRRAVASQLSGSTRQRISRKNLAKITFPCPPRAVQDQLVAETEKQFSRLDEAVANLKRVKANLKRYKASVLKAAYRGVLTSKMLTQESPAGVLPEGWAWSTIRNKRGHKEREFDLTGVDGNQYRLILRLSDFNPLDFSVVLAFCPTDTNQIFRLRRYNGKSHEHSNPIERVTFYDFHIHQATERYQDLGAREDAYAEPADRYSNYQSALDCLLADCGFEIPRDPQLPLF